LLSNSTFNINGAQKKKPTALGVAFLLSFKKESKVKTFLSFLKGKKSFYFTLLS
jgi:hypothetical protein